MSDELSLVDRGEPQSRPRCHSNDKESILDTVSYFAIGFVFVGVIFSAIGFLYPRDLNLDPQASAAENERLEQDYQKLSEALNAIIIAGMILTSLGGLILSALFTNTVVCRECSNDSDPRTPTSSRQMTSQHQTSSASGRTGSTNAAGGNPATDYGTVSHPTNIEQ